MKIVSVDIIDAVSYTHLPKWTRSSNSGGFPLSDQRLSGEIVAASFWKEARTGCVSNGCTLVLSTSSRVAWQSSSLKPSSWNPESSSDSNRAGSERSTSTPVSYTHLQQALCLPYGYIQEIFPQSWKDLLLCYR